MNSQLPVQEDKNKQNEMVQFVLVQLQAQANYRTRNNGAKLIGIHFNTSVAQHFYSDKITTTRNALPGEVVSSRTVNSFKNSLDKHWAENHPNARVNW